MDKERNLEWLKADHGLTLDQVNALYHYGQYQYTYGDYSGASSYLYHFLILSPDLDLNLSAHWGKLSSDILMGTFDVALTDLKDLRELIDNPQTKEMAKPNVQLQQRTWILHWSLFVFFNHEQGRQGLFEMFMSPAYLNTIQTACPHLLRYLTFAVILLRRSSLKLTSGTRTIRDPIKELIKILATEHSYSDPLTRFVNSLYSEFDFEGARENLKEAETLVENDFFTSQFKESFVDEARWLVSEVYCRIHRRIDIG